MISAYQQIRVEAVSLLGLSSGGQSSVLLVLTASIPGFSDALFPSQTPHHCLSTDYTVPNSLPMWEALEAVINENHARPCPRPDLRQELQLSPSVQAPESREPCIAFTSPLHHLDPLATSLQHLSAPDEEAQHLQEVPAPLLPSGAAPASSSLCKIRGFTLQRHAPSVPCTSAELSIPRHVAAALPCKDSSLKKGLGKPASFL
ncbi:hypothetical protein Anapl_02493 [Anas platyrhynchos]|uniref:Uncharacterized protein n=1 Tax=Anas platyrhynchos TaxID=8839 RepID=R0LJU0_ANAPL|nr:hypothetical protein Anapl_02493 [Anas platyrhynchos]